MNKQVKGVYLIVGIIILSVFFILLISFPDQVAISLVISPNWIAAAFLFLTCVIITALNWQLFRIIRARKNDAKVAELLFGVFLFVGFITIVQGLLGIIIFSPIKLNLLFMQSIYIFLAGCIILLNSFVLEVFGGGLRYKLNLFWVLVVIICASISIFGVVKNILVGITTYEAIGTSLPAIICLFYVFLKFIISSFKTSAKVERGVIHQSFQYMGWGGLGLLLGFLLLGLGAITKISESMGDSPEYFVLLILVHVLILGGVACIYLGFTRPIKNDISNPTT